MSYFYYKNSLKELNDTVKASDDLKVITEGDDVISAVGIDEVSPNFTRAATLVVNGVAQTDVVEGEPEPGL